MSDFELTSSGGLRNRSVVLPPGDGPVSLFYDAERDLWTAERDGVVYERPGDLSGTWRRVEDDPNERRKQ